MTLLPLPPTRLGFRRPRRRRSFTRIVLTLATLVAIIDLASRLNES